MTHGLGFTFYSSMQSLQSLCTYLLKVTVVFAVFILQSVQVPVYTTQEYQLHLHDDKWTKNATDHLFDLCSRFDLRWVVIHDRFDSGSYGVSRLCTEI